MPQVVFNFAFHFTLMSLSKVTVTTTTATTSTIVRPTTSAIGSVSQEHDLFLFCRSFFQTILLCFITELCTGFTCSPIVPCQFVPVFNSGMRIKHYFPWIRIRIRLSWKKPDPTPDPSLNRNEEKNIFIF